MKMLVFSTRTMKEVVRDPLNIGFGLAFPLVLLLLLTAIQRNIPVEIFTLDSLVPGVCVFGLSFMTLFSAMLVSRDRETAFLERLYTTPLGAADFILGYALPFLPLSLVQGAICFAVSLILGLEPSWNILFSIVMNIPSAIFYIGLGLLCGSALGSKQVGGVCGALLVNLSAWLSGTWFDVAMVGKVFEGIAKAFPFWHSVELGRVCLSGAYGDIWPHLFIVLIYALLAVVGAILMFLRQMKRQ